MAADEVIEEIPQAGAGGRRSGRPPYECPKCPYRIAYHDPWDANETNIAIGAHEAAHRAEERARSSDDRREG